MYKYISTDEINDIVSTYYQMAVDSNNAGRKDHFVIFSMGSMMSINDEELGDVANHFAGYTPEHMETWPAHQIKNSPDAPSVSEIYRDLVNIWKQQSEDSSISSVIKCGFKKLIDNQITSEITPILCDIDGTHIIEFCKGVNIVFCEDLNTTDLNTTDLNTKLGELGDRCSSCIEHAITLRSFDLMFPQVYAIITPDLELILCVVELDNE
jgi:hypothetical protein